MAIFLIDLVARSLETRRVWVGWGIVLKRRKNPIGYWLMTSAWSLLALGTSAGVVWLLCVAIIGSGPYAQHPFFSLDQAWPLAVSSAVLGWLAAKIVTRRLRLWRHGRAA
ncbi:hypothetical protein LJR168_002330 [Pseudoxanthomonas sp. LjRoot168]|uniref:hypothetical protein n=1 Tax=unclassified Pseudoxanthomonas TaxID=2645906 RepID=UPI003ECDC51A